MIRFLRCAAVSVAFLMPIAASSQPLDCPDVAAVFASDDAAVGAVSLGQLAERVGDAATKGEIPRSVAEDLRRDLSETSDAEIADLMITAYCTYLRDEAPESQRSEANVRAFEEQVYQAVFGGAPPSDYQKKGWLYGD